jgi:hypothetical protein
MESSRGAFSSEPPSSNDLRLDGLQIFAGDCVLVVAIAKGISWRSRRACGQSGRIGLDHGNKLTRERCHDKLTKHLTILSASSPRQKKQILMQSIR